MLILNHVIALKIKNSHKKSPRRRILADPAGKGSFSDLFGVNGSRPGRAAVQKFTLSFLPARLMTSASSR